ncbi:hypothetical protein L1887_23892 [Cichorium endivia]|nr:hypothetical protein L1887_23892 [Cichorium endivia]
MLVLLLFDDISLVIDIEKLTIGPHEIDEEMDMVRRINPEGEVFNCEIKHPIPSSFGNLHNLHDLEMMMKDSVPSSFSDRGSVRDKEYEKGVYKWWSSTAVIIAGSQGR